MFFQEWESRRNQLNASGIYSLARLLIRILRRLLTISVCSTDVEGTTDVRRDRSPRDQPRDRDNQGTGHKVTKRYNRFEAYQEWIWTKPVQSWTSRMKTPKDSVAPTSMDPEALVDDEAEERAVRVSQ